MTSVTSLSVGQRVLTGNTYLTSKFKLSNCLSTLYAFIALALSSSTVNGLIDVEKPITTASSRKWIEGVTQENVRSMCAPMVSSLVCVRLMIFSLVMVSFIELHRSRVQPTCITSGTFPASWYSYNPVTKTYVGSSDRRVCQSTQSDRTRLPLFRIATKT
jgi:1,4-dihydroxy-2-naphthoate octaprenyltransferase